MKITFMGTPDFAVPVLQYLLEDPAYEVVCVVTQPDRPKGRKHRLTPPPVKVLAEKFSVPVLQPEKVRKAEAIQEILAFGADLLVTAAYGQILPESLLKGPRLGCVNVHASLLPAYRGAAPIQQSIIDGQKESGVTIMYMVKQLDAGDILSQVRVPIEDQDTFGTLHDKLSTAGSNLLMETLPKLEAGSLTPRPQNEKEVTFAPSIQHEDEEIVWEKSASAVRNLIRGLNPFPGAFTRLEGSIFKLFAAELTDLRTAEKPGTIIQSGSEGFFVATGNGQVIKIVECQPAGKKRMKAVDFLRGTRLKNGTVLGVK
ncbi:methionyl-tRNA formyltransferase [Sporolactobacillus shoreicorticis]|uniref:Methionyl-tRNA formyltransferase n=1 Tax=Sporolactobacillus shoreicorticis TaxID=1923877 RepID=A0ABW5S2T8_9BACL|nr:methionyl-tRNA formyltransferase [Sporolactobacillus shoreicorticis]MCO7127982.1 methionyl-tRNA formyltransferase [Sporolactobacillus shoreicorticis]